MDGGWLYKRRGSTKPGQLRPLIRLSGRSVRANLTLDEGVVAFIGGEARRRRMTRTAFVEWMARRIAQEGG